MYSTNHCKYVRSTHHKLKMYIVASQRGISPTVNISTPCVYKRAWHASVGYAKRIQWAALIEPLLRGLCINMMQTIASYLKNVHSTHHKEVFRPGEYIHTLRLTSKLVDLRVGYAKRIQELCSWATSHRSLHRYDARCCIISMQRYRSGYNGADSKFCSHFGTSHLEPLDL